jgi:lipoprotein-releasing system permease protein
VGGIAIGTAALVLILSVFNGFEELITSMFSSFHPDVMVAPETGKTFKLEAVPLDSLRSLSGVEALSVTLEEIAFLEHNHVQDFGMIKGVDEFYAEVVDIEATMLEGGFLLMDNSRPMVVLGSALRNKLSVNVLDPFASVRVYVPKRGRVGPLERPYTSALFAPSGTFFIQQDFDSEYAMADLGVVQNLLQMTGSASALELRVRPGFSVEQVKSNVSELLGEGFSVKDQYQQDEAFRKVMNIEKWMAFAILGFTMVLVAFNMIGALWMIVIEKKQDISILRSMGADAQCVRGIFLWEGMLLSGLGLIIGFSVSLLVFAGQKFFGIVPIPAGFVIDAYPISLKGIDFCAVVMLVGTIGMLASLPAANRAAKIPPIVRSE